MTKRIPLWFLTNFFVLFLTIGLVAATLSQLAQPQKVTSWLDKSGLYQKLPQALIQQAQSSTTNTPEVATNFSNPLVVEAARSALSPDFVKQSSEEVVNETFRWLKGATPKPAFSIELQPIKQKFADNLSAALLNRYEALPACGAAQLPASTDPFTIDCRPSMGVDINAVVATEKAKILADPSFLEKPSLNADNVWSYGQGGSEKMLQNKELPDAYQALQILPYISVGILLCIALGIVVISDTRKAGFRKIGWRLTIVGVLWLIAVDLGALGLTKIRQLAESQGEQAAVTAFKDIVSPGLTAFRNDTIKISAVLGGAVLILGVLLLAITHVKKNKLAKEKPVNDPKPEPAKTATVTPKAEDPKPKATPTTKTNTPKMTVPTAPLLKPKQQQKPAVITPTKPIGGDNSLIQ